MCDLASIKGSFRAAGFSRSILNTISSDPAWETYLNRKLRGGIPHFMSQVTQMMGSS